MCCQADTHRHALQTEKLQNNLSSEAILAQCVCQVVNIFTPWSDSPLMSEPSLYAGAALRRLRRREGLTQAVMAQRLSISPSYLNLIERNQRPVTARVVVELVDQFDYDPRALQDYLEYANAKAFVARTGATIKHGGDKAFYVPSKDAIMLPAREAFIDGAAYYATLFHELTHWTGADKRLDRKQGGKFGSNDYAFEELVAEIGAAFLCSDMGVSNEEPRADHAQYLKHWLEILRASDKAIGDAASQAGKATEYLNELTAVRVAA